MAKLTKVQRRRIDYALRNAERAMRYLQASHIAVCRRGPATTTLHYRREDGAALYEVDKDIGSDLVGLQSCIEELRSLLSESLSEVA